MRLARKQCVEAVLVFVPRADFYDRPELRKDNGKRAADLSCFYGGQTLIDLVKHLPDEDGFLCYVVRKGQT